MKCTTWFACMICDRAFESKENYREHTLAFHPKPATATTPSIQNQKQRPDIHSTQLTGQETSELIGASTGTKERIRSIIEARQKSGGQGRCNGGRGSGRNSGIEPKTKEKAVVEINCTTNRLEVEQEQALNSSKRIDVTPAPVDEQGASLDLPKSSLSANSFQNEGVEPNNTSPPLLLNFLERSTENLDAFPAAHSPSQYLQGTNKTQLASTPNITLCSSLKPTLLDQPPVLRRETSPNPQTPNNLQKQLPIPSFTPILQCELLNSEPADKKPSIRIRIAATYFKKTPRDGLKVIDNPKQLQNHSTVAATSNNESNSHSKKNLSFRNKLNLSLLKPKPSHICKYCLKRFLRKNALNLHLRSHKGQAISQCPHCPKSFAEPSALTLHLRRHTGEKPFICPLCSNAFSQQGNLEAHLRRHTYEKPFFCTLCPKTFRQASGLNAHLLIHKGLKPFHCIPCGKRFRQSSNLRQHLCTAQKESKPYYKLGKKKTRTRTNIGENFLAEFLKLRSICKPSSSTKAKSRIPEIRGCFKCENCQREFSKPLSLILHKSRHCPIRKDQSKTKSPLSPKMGGFKCDECSLTFTEQRGLSIHKTVVHGDLRCKTCSKRFPTASQLAIHMKEIHGGVEVVSRSPQIAKSNSPQRKTMPMLEKQLIKFRVSNGHWACELCPKVFESAKDLSEHLDSFDHGKRKRRASTKMEELVEVGRKRARTKSEIFTRNFSAVEDSPNSTVIVQDIKFDVSTPTRASLRFSRAKSFHGELDVLPSSPTLPTGKAKPSSTNTRGSNGAARNVVIDEITLSDTSSEGQKSDEVEYLGRVVKEDGDMECRRSRRTRRNTVAAATIPNSAISARSSSVAEILEEFAARPARRARRKSTLGVEGETSNQVEIPGPEESLLVKIPKKRGRPRKDSQVETPSLSRKPELVPEAPIVRSSKRKTISSIVQQNSLFNYNFTKGVESSDSGSSGEQVRSSDKGKDISVDSLMPAVQAKVDGIANRISKRMAAKKSDKSKTYEPSVETVGGNSELASIPTLDKETNMNIISSPSPDLEISDTSKLGADPILSNLFICSKCGLRFLAEAAFKIHLEFHDNEDKVQISSLSRRKPLQSQTLGVEQVKDLNSIKVDVLSVSSKSPLLSDEKSENVREGYVKSLRGSRVSNQSILDITESMKNQVNLNSGKMQRLTRAKSEGQVETSVSSLEGAKDEFSFAPKPKQVESSEITGESSSTQVADINIPSKFESNVSDSENLNVPNEPEVEVGESPSAEPVACSSRSAYAIEGNNANGNSSVNVPNPSPIIPVLNPDDFKHLPGLQVSLSSVSSTEKEKRRKRKERQWRHFLTFVNMQFTQSLN